MILTVIPPGFYLHSFPAHFEWLFPWRPINDRYTVMRNNLPPDYEHDENENPFKVLGEELKSEVPEGHELYGAQVRPVAVHVLTHKDFVFSTDNPSAPIAVVHLTWKSESDPAWPMTRVFLTLEDWSEKMAKDHDANKHDQVSWENAFRRFDNSW